MNYQEFIKSKIAVAPQGGFEVAPEQLPEILKPHQRDIVRWALRGGQRAVFASFGLGKTAIQLAIMKLIVERQLRQNEGKPPKPTLIIAPLGVKQEFTRDARELFQLELHYIRTDSELRENGFPPFCITNYERVRDGQLKPENFIAVSLDEASILRGFGTKTYQEFLPLCSKVKYKFVATATPSPNELKELIHYAGFLGVMDTGEALTRFFQRNSEKAGDLTLYPHKEREFWMWVASWAVFLNRPSDLGYSDEGYDLPPLRVEWHRVDIDHLAKVKIDRDGQQEFFHDAARSLPDAAREKRDTIALRDALCPSAKVSVLSNATQLHREEVRRALLRVDNNILKLDSAFDATARLMNNPQSSAYTVRGVVEQMKGFDGRLTVQTMFLRGECDGQKTDNTTEEEVSAWLRLIEEIRPRQVMVYSLDRDTPCRTLEKVPREELQAIAARVEALGIPCSVA